MAGTPPIRAKKARYYEDARFKERLLSPPSLTVPTQGRPDDWTTLPRPARPELLEAGSAADDADEDPTESERRRQPELNRMKPVEKKLPVQNEFEIDVEHDDEDDEAVRNSRITRMMQGVARQVSLDPNDGMEL